MNESFKGIARLAGTWITGSLLLASAVAAAACSGGASTNETPAAEKSAGSSTALLAKVEQSTDWTDSIEHLRRAGWLGGNTADAHVMRTAQGHSGLALTFSRADEQASIDLVYVAASDGEAQVAVRPANDASRAAFDRSVKQAPQNEQSVGIQSACDPGCNATNCVFWQCEYNEADFRSPACRTEASDEGPAHRERIREGTTDSTNCSAYYADAHGNGIFCPYPNRTFAYVVCD
ncbi:hypothetical protein LVJ94_03865 [Pendulispora rubella]|uniref:Lipoprotein n=1 Tax=Pendulispora rubella TaxID=2741070 RepID=A0ABZ2L612_9BACT